MFGKIIVGGVCHIQVYCDILGAIRVGLEVMLVGESSVHSRKKEVGIGKFPAFLFKRVRLVLLDIEKHARGAIP